MIQKHNCIMQFIREKERERVSEINTKKGTLFENSIDIE